MLQRSSSALSSILLQAFTLGLSVVWAGAATATTDIQVRVEKCSARQYIHFDDARGRERDKTKYHDFLIDGTSGSPITWHFSDDFSVSFAASPENLRKATYVDDAALDAVAVSDVLAKFGLDGGFNLIESEVSGKRRVGQKVKKSRDRFKFTAQVAFTDGPNTGRVLGFRLRAHCKGVREDPVVPPPPEPLLIVVLGSSTSAGKNLDAPQHGGRVGGLVDRYSNLYETYLDERWAGSTVVNLGRPGAKTYEALPTDTATPIPGGLLGPNPDRNVTYALSLDPDAILINFPSLGAPTVGQYVANHREVFDEAAAANVPVWVALPNPGSLPSHIAGQVALRDGLLAEFPATRILDFYGARVGPDELSLPATLLLDGIHPNALGHSLLFDEVVAADLPSALGLTAP